MSFDKYNVVMFAYNEEKNITSSIESVFANTDVQVNKFYLIANGCTDKTLEVAERVKQQLNFEKLELIELELGDKCNAWNVYVHEIAAGADTHFFTDADVKFSNGCFSQLHKKLTASDNETVVVAGMPLSGRNIEFYRSLVIERACFFGNLYGMKLSFINRMREASFRLPVGLNWIDSFLTKAVNTDLSFSKTNIPNRTCYVEGVGYEFDSLSPFKKDDIKLYVNRIARYELGKLQEIYLDELPVKEWPAKMHPINLQIEAEFDRLTKNLSLIKRFLVKKRLHKLLSKG